MTETRIVYDSHWQLEILLCFYLFCVRKKIKLNMKSLPIYPVPFGEGSMHWTLYFRNDEIPMTWAQAALWHYLHYRSNYDTGKSHIMSVDEIVQETQFSERFVYQTRKHHQDVGFILGWYKRKGGSVYEIVKYVDTSRLQTGELDLRYWAPRRGFKGQIISESPISCWIDGKIRASDFILWMALNRHSDWRSGPKQGEVTMTHEWMIKLTGLSKYLVKSGLKRLKDANLVYKVSQSTHQSTYVLYPFIQAWHERAAEFERNAAALLNVSRTHDELWHDISWGDGVDSPDPDLPGCSQEEAQTE